MNEHIAEPGPASPPVPLPPDPHRGGALLAAEEDRSGPDPPGRSGPDDPRGCLFALSQPPLMLFLGFIGLLLLLAAVHDLYAG
ncbi:hypothetical protein [Streptomyces meridianus]|uniref:Uncharacterized protein n=1 Tax=Streptomyces meridianus TaxID=2938945 RepID=A0ABT0X3J4_9ACTN|nr:hypothetical protein [Streptomyces meridianus]MCM2577116.1 hypothetical protein [Streptomyces meridianus]